MRFYDRQFITREDLNKGILGEFETLLNDYFDSDKPQTIGFPSVGYFAEQLNLSANYFGDLMKKETGKSAQEHLHLKLIDKAKEKIFDSAYLSARSHTNSDFNIQGILAGCLRKKQGIRPMNTE